LATQPQTFTPFTTDEQWEQCVPSTRCTAVTHQGSSGSISNPLPSRRTRAADTWEHHQGVPIQVTHHSNLEIYRCPFTVTGLKSWNSHPNSTVGVPTPQGLQQFKKLAHHNLLKGTEGRTINVGPASDAHIPLMKKNMKLLM